MIKNVKAIIFDQGGVLMPSVYTFDLRLLYSIWKNGLPKWVDVPKKVKMERNTFLLEMAKHIRREYEFQSTTSNSFNVVQSLSKFWKEKTNSEISYLEIGTWVMLLSQLESQPLYANVLDVLDKLYLKGIKLGIVSNNLFFGTQHRFRLNELGVMNLLSCVIYSSELGIRKPSEIPFEIACKMMDVSYAETIIVGDKYETDGVAAEKLSIRYFCLCHEKKMAAENNFQISNIDELTILID